MLSRGFGSRPNVTDVTDRSELADQRDQGLPRNHPRQDSKCQSIHMLMPKYLYKMREEADKT